MAAFLQQLTVGLANGTVFALIALGYSLVYSVLGLINFAHGDVFMLAALLALVLLDATPAWAWHSPWGVLAVLGTMAVCALVAGGLNWALDRWVFRAVRRQHRLTPLVAAIGASLVLQNVGLLCGALPLAAFAGGHAPAAPKSFVQPLSADNLLPASVGLHVSAREALAAAVCTLAWLGTYALVHRTRVGRALRAVAEDRVAARLMGVDVERTVGWAFFLGGALAGVAAVVYGLFVGTAHYQMGFQNGLYAFVAAVVGGLGSVGGALVGGLLIGMCRAVCDLTLGSQWQPAVLFGLLLAVLFVRPRGLFGPRGLEKV